MMAGSAVFADIVPIRSMTLSRNYEGYEIPSGPFQCCSRDGRFVPLREGIAFCEKGQEFTAGVLIDQHVYEAVGSIDDIDYQALHFVVVQTRHFGPWNDAVRTADGDIRVISGCRRRGDACMEILQH